MNETPSIDMEELYETKQKMDINRLNIYNKLLSRVHNRIKTSSRQRENNQFCWFLMPELLVGYPNYDISECLMYIIDRLERDGFLTRYVHPNLIFISWNHYVPQYVRNEIKTKTGVVVDKYGKEIKKETKRHSSYSNQINDTQQQQQHRDGPKKQVVELENNRFKKKPQTIEKFQPSGKFLYDSKFFDSIQKNM
jgi:hypothetical protein